MLTPMNLNDDRVIAFEASGKVTDADYKDVLIPALDQLIADTGAVRFLMYLGPDFEGYSAHAAVDDARLAGKVHNKAERIAIVTDNKLFEGGANFASHFTSMPIRGFKADDLDAAKAWVTE